MAFVNRTANGHGRLTETKPLPAGVGTNYSSEINGIKVDQLGKKATQYVTFQCIASAVAGTNIDIDLYGAFTSGGTKFLLISNLVTALTNASKSQGTVKDIKAYPAPFYYIAYTNDADNSANTITFNIGGDLNGSQS